MTSPSVIVAAVAAIACLSLSGSARAQDAASGLAPERPRCEYLVDPVGVDDAHPRLSWTLASPARGERQTAYRIGVASTPAKLQAGDYDLWDSGRVESGAQNQIAYAGKPLASRQTCFWRVRVWDAAGRPGPWGPAAKWEVGLARPDDWHAQWIGDGFPDPAPRLEVLSARYESTVDGGKSADVTGRVKPLVKDGTLDFSVNNTTLGGDPAFKQTKQLVLRYAVGGSQPIEQAFQENAHVRLSAHPPQVMRRGFRVERKVTRARLYATALGIYDVRLNGKPVTDSVFTPDWTDYRDRVRYQAYDVTDLLRAGDNAIAATVAAGFYSGQIGNGGFQVYGKKPALLAQLELTYDDGTVDRVCTDSVWQSHAGPLRIADVMAGETYDARSAFEASDPATLVAGGWSPVRLRTDGLPPRIDPQVAEPVRPLTTLTAKSVSEPTPGHYVYDFGQNAVGVPRLKINAPAGTTVTIRFAEMINADGTLYTTNYRRAISTDVYVCRGGGEEVWQPTTTYHGYRYAELTGLPAKPTADTLTTVVQGSDTPAAGKFACSDERLNKLWSNIQWGQRGNFFGVPTDCPQRDERLGWMGDAQVFIGTAAYNADVAAFFTKWLVDVDDEQAADGRYPDTAPNLTGAGTPGWGDAGVICPWTIYGVYGDARVLERHLPAMKRWVDWCREHSTGLIRDKDRGSDFGDWLSIGANTSKELLGTAYFARSADLVARACAVVGDKQGAETYDRLFEDIKAAFRKRYVKPDGTVGDGTQTAYALALAFDLLPEAARASAAEKLAADVHAKGDRLSTGFLGVSYLLPALADHGQRDAAFTLLRQDAFPSWLFSVKHGATTIWERWDGWTPDKGFQDPGMNSFNHYSLGSCGKWMMEAVAGIAQVPGGHGFDRLAIRPQVGGGLTHASGEYESVRGLIRSAWKLDNGRLTLDVTVPPNVTAVVTVPTTDPTKVTESGRPADKADGVSVTGPATYDIGSGTYHFEAPFVQ